MGKGCQGGASVSAMMSGDLAMMLCIIFCLALCEIIFVILACVFGGMYLGQPTTMDQNHSIATLMAVQPNQTHIQLINLDQGIWQATIGVQFNTSTHENENCTIWFPERTSVVASEQDVAIYNASTTGVYFFTGFYATRSDHTLQCTLDTQMDSVDVPRELGLNFVLLVVFGILTCIGGMTLAYIHTNRCYRCQQFFQS
jgi:hypothetical protein